MTPGAVLRNARTERKLSLSDVCRQTKVQPWVLEALEGDTLQTQMSPIYVKGFLATYAKFLRLEPEPLLAQIPWPKTEPEPEPLPAAPAPMPVAIEIPWALLRRVGLGLAACVVVIGVIKVNPLRHLPRLSLAQPAASAKASAKGPAPSARGAKLASVTPLIESAKPPVLPTLALLPTQPLDLNVSAQQTTWIQVRADGKLVTQQRLQRGATEHWTAKKKLELVVAKPSQVELVLNGQSISPFAVAHEGRLIITHYGVTKLPNEPQR